MTAIHLDEQAIFEVARKIDSREAREAYLQQICGDDAAIGQRVRDLLKAYEESASFLEPSAAAPVGTIDAPAPAERPGTIIGPYKLLQQIGEGGMGTVYMAEQTQPVQRKVALKVIKAGMDSRQVIARFEAERQALAMMDHVNIARVLDAGATESGLPYFVMELVHGVPITKYCEDNHLTPRERLELFVPVCQAIQHAHQKGVIHRDIKPSNVMVTLYDGKPVPKVIDFGVAKATAQKLTERTLFTQYGTMVGTLEYMSPEQAEMSALGVDTRSDIYSLGVLLYELLTGSTPLTRKRFKDAAYGEILRIIKEEEPPKPSTRLSDSGEALASISAQRKTEPAKLSKLMRGELDWIVMKTLEKDRNRRYETANGFAADVQRYLNDEPVQACPPSAMYRVRKFVRRNKRVLATVGLLALALIVGTVVSAWQAIRATTAEHLALRAEHLALDEAAATARERDEKEAALRSAKDELATREAVLKFVENKIFAAARPKDQEGGLGHEVQLRQAIEAALPFVEKSFMDQPLVEARLRQTLGISFEYLGDAKVAAEQLQAARMLYAQHCGPDHLDTLRSMLCLATSYYALGRYADALKLDEETLALMKAKLGPDHPDTLISMNNLANTYAALGRYADAFKLREETLALRKARSGPGHPDTLASMNNLANSYEVLGRDAEALKLREETLALRKARLGPDHPETLVSMYSLANSYEDFGRDAEALKLREETLALLKAKLGPDHPETLRSMTTLAMSYAALGRHADALKLNEEALALRKAKLGPDHPNTLKSMSNLATSYAALGQHAEALKLREETLALMKAKLGPDHPDTLASMNNLANTYAALGRYADALKLNEKTLALRKAKLGLDHPDTLSSMYNLANSYYALGRYADALKLNEEALALRKAKLGPDHPDTLWSTYLSMWGVAKDLVKLDRGAEAVPIIDECVQRVAGKVGHPSMIPEVMDLRLRHFEKSKDATGCRATAEMWEKLKRIDADSLYNAACMRAVTAAVIRGTDLKSVLPTKDAAAEADRAMAWLTQAIAAGYKDAAHIKEDTDLDALRDRGDFKKLLAQLAAGQEKDKK
jgi:eukaryotic-like serine/threonine-protein kinase